MKSSAQTLDLAPAADVVGGGERRDVAVFVVGREARDAAHFAECTVVEQEFDTFPAGQLAPATLSDDAGIFGAGREAFVGERLHRSDILQEWRPSVLRLVVTHTHGSGLGLDDREHLPRLDAVACAQGLYRHYRAVAGCRHLGFHLHRANDDEGIARADVVALLDTELQHGAGHGTGHGLLSRRDVERCGGAANRSNTRTTNGGNAHDRGLLLEQGQGAVAVAFDG